MKLTILLFAAAKEAVGQSHISVELTEGADVQTLRQTLADNWPQLTAAAVTLHIAVNGEFTNNDQTLQESDEVACFPPVSGG
ncbi:MAG: molybdopterin converting factor subunit 1 [Planctomycetaceae bacterium]|nr:molybdopterin converting factor subunit 1 [Planctomycetaceae bacterium]